MHPSRRFVYVQVHRVSGKVQCVGESVPYACVVHGRHRDVQSSLCATERAGDIHSQSVAPHRGQCGWMEQLRHTQGDMVVLLMQKGAQGLWLSNGRIGELLAQGLDTTAEVVSHQTRHHTQVGLFVFVEVMAKGWMAVGLGMEMRIGAGGAGEAGEAGGAGGVWPFVRVVVVQEVVPPKERACHKSHSSQ